MANNFYTRVETQLTQLQENGLYKHEYPVTGPQQAHIQTADKKYINLCANNYLGLANHPELITTAKESLEKYGFGMASVRFICGTQQQHQDLEKQIAQFLGMDDSLLYSSCFDANTGLFETLLDEQDAIISDALNHASLIDGIRLCKASRYRYQNNDMHDLRRQLEIAREQGARDCLIVTDGVFSMDGVIANLPDICDIADEFNALVLVDDSHAVGVLGKRGVGTPEYHQVQGRVDILTGTFGKALGGASGGYTAAKSTVIQWLRQRSRPYLFSNALAPCIVATTQCALSLVQNAPYLRDKLGNNSVYFRDALSKAGYDLAGADHPIIPVMIGDAKLANEMTQALRQRGIFVIAFSYPVVPKDKARIRVQMSCALSRADLDKAIHAFVEVGNELDLLDHGRPRARFS